jgi:hypothetical protein
VNPRRRVQSIATVLPAFALLAAPSARAVEEFHAYLLPDTTVADVDSLFPVSFTVDATAHEFNGYEVTIRFDPSRVQYVSVASGALMNDACDTRFSPSSSTDSTATYTDVLLCDGVSVDGPGVLAVFTFRAVASGVSPLEIISDPDLTFVDDGLYVRPQHPTYPRQVIFHDAVVRVGGAGTGIGMPSPAALDGPALLFYPNPTPAGGTFRLTLPRAGPATLRVVDAAGRLLLSREWALAPAGASQASWTGTAPGGRLLPNGVYFAQLRTPAGTAAGKLVLVR